MNTAEQIQRELDRLGVSDGPDGLNVVETNEELPEGYVAIGDTEVCYVPATAALAALRQVPREHPGDDQDEPERAAWERAWQALLSVHGYRTAPAIELVA